MGDYENALTHLYELTELKSDCADLYVFRAEIHKHLGNVDFTNLDMIKAKELNPNHPNLHAILEWIISICVHLKNKADYEILKSHHTEAMLFLNHAIDLDPLDYLLLIKRYLESDSWLEQRYLNIKRIGRMQYRII